MRVLTLVGLLATCAAAYPPIWPLPSRYTLGTETATVNPEAKFTTPCATSDDLTAAIARFRKITFGHTANPSADGAAHALSTVNVCMGRGDAPLQLGMDEAYTLAIDYSSVNLECQTQVGCYRGLESLSQLITFSPQSERYAIHNLPMRINDEPRFVHRGLLIDTSRHFLPLRVLRTVLDGMSFTKLNTMHWHIVDAIAFPFVSPSHPKLSEFGSFSPTERYSVADVASIVEYARKLGIRVMVEFDIPGHTGAMCFGEPDICPNPMCSSPNINNWALDITQNYTYEVVNNVMKDLTHIFPEEMLHLGGDEVIYSCWRATPYIMEWLRQRNMDVKDGFLYFTKKAHAMARDLKRSVVGWQEIWEYFGTALDKKTIIQQWLPNSISLPLNVTSNGYRLIWSDSSVWYLDHLKVTWQEMYNAEPCKGLPDANCKLVVGGEGCMWGETVDTSDLLQTIFPRAAAIAERLWSPRGTALDKHTQDRLIAFRCLLNKREIAAAPVLNGVGRSAPSGPGSCYGQ